MAQVAGAAHGAEKLELVPPDRMPRTLPKARGLGHGLRVLRDAFSETAADWRKSWRKRSPSPRTDRLNVIVSRRNTWRRVCRTITRSAAAPRRGPLQRALGRHLREAGLPLLWSQVPVPRPHRVRDCIGEAHHERYIRPDMAALPGCWEELANRVNEPRYRAADDLHQRRKNLRSRF